MGGSDSAPSADVNECLNSEICSPNGECLNSHGSYFCICAPGFSNTAGGVSCQGGSVGGEGRTSSPAPCSFPCCKIQPDVWGLVLQTWMNAQTNPGARKASA